MPTQTPRETGRPEPVPEAQLGRPAATADRSVPDVHFTPLFGVAPRGGRRRRLILLVASVGAHIVLGAVIAVLPSHAPFPEGPRLPITFVLSAAIPAPERPAPPPPPPPPPRREPMPRPLPESKPVPRVEPPPAPKPEPKIDVVPAVAKVVVPKPVPVVRTNVFEDPSPHPRAAAPKPVAAAIEGFDREKDGGRAAAPKPAVAAAEGFDRENDGARPAVRAPAILVATGFPGTVPPSAQGAARPRGRRSPRQASMRQQYGPRGRRIPRCARVASTSQHGRPRASGSEGLERPTSMPRSRSSRSRLPSTPRRRGGFASREMSCSA